MTTAKPIRLKKLAGTYRKDRDPAPGLNPPIPGRMWPAPAWMDDRARRVWLRLGGDLREAGLLTVLDRDLFLILCTHIGRWAQIQEELKGQALVSADGKNPLLMESRQLGESIRKLASEFGLEPAARARALAWAGDAEEEQDELAALLFRHAARGDDEEA